MSYPFRVTVLSSHPPGRSLHAILPHRFSRGGPISGCDCCSGRDRCVHAVALGGRRFGHEFKRPTPSLFPPVWVCPRGEKAREAAKIETLPSNAHRTRTDATPRRYENAMLPVDESCPGPPSHFARCEIDQVSRRGPERLPVAIIQRVPALPPKDFRSM